MGWRWPAWSRSPTALPNAALRRSCSRPKAKEAGCRITVGEDKAYDTADHVARLRAINENASRWLEVNAETRRIRKQGSVEGIPA